MNKFHELPSLQNNTLIFHFDIESHRMPIADLVQTVTSFNLICNDFCHALLKKEYSCELYVYPSEEGSFKTCVQAVILGYLAYAATEFGDGILKSLTGKNHSDYGMAVGEMIVDMVTGFYKKPDIVVPNSLNLDASFKARSDYYKMCLDNNDIKGVGYSNKHQFPISRRDFYAFIRKDIIKTLPSICMLRRLVVHKPVTTNTNLRWTFKDVASSKCVYAHIDDVAFRSEFMDGNHPLRKTNIDDVLVALVKYELQLKNGKLKIAGQKVVEVYQFNNDALKPIPEIYQNGQPRILDASKSEMLLFNNVFGDISSDEYLEHIKKVKDDFSDNASGNEEVLDLFPTE